MTAADKSPDEKRIERRALGMHWIISGLGWAGFLFVAGFLGTAGSLFGYTDDEGFFHTLFGVEPIGQFGFWPPIGSIDRLVHPTILTDYLILALVLLLGLQLIRVVCGLCLVLVNRS
jgi:hypothetical protein